MDFVPNIDSENEKLLLEEKKNKRLGIHSFHRYYGKLIPAIPSTFIKKYSKEGDTIFDPFTGSGTTAVEAIFNNRNFIGYEINPLAQKIASVKTTKFDPDLLMNFNDGILNLIKSNNFIFLEKDLPFVVNRDHWFKEFVQKDLMKIKNSIDYFFSDNPFSLEIKQGYLDFYYMSISAILRNVSNADTRHVFPGISKRMRELEAQGKINIDTISSFERAIKKRTKYFEYFSNDNESTSRIILGDSSKSNLSNLENKIDLVITNPPYISSVRYIETLKLEMYWLEFIKNQNEYSELSHKMLGNDRLLKKQYENIEYTNFQEINTLINTMYEIDKKCAKIVSNFFNSMEKVIKNMSLILKNNGKMVIKISDSKLKKIKIPTPEYLNIIGSKYGFKLIDLFIDEIDEKSRSLTTARNYYSDIITYDYIIVWELNRC